MLHALALVIALASPGAPSGDAPDAGAKPSGPLQRLGGDVAVEPLLAPDDVKGLRAVFHVDAPPDVVLETLWDVHRFRQIFPDIHSLDVVAEHGTDCFTAGNAAACSIDAHFTVDAVLATVSYTLRRDLDRPVDGQGGRVVWKNIGGDLKLVRGSWTVKPAHDGTSSDVTYTSFVDVGTFVPTGMVRDIAMSKVEQMAGRVRDACKKAVAQRAVAVPAAAALATGPSTTTEPR